MTTQSPLERAYRSLAGRRQFWERAAIVAVSGGVDSVVLLDLLSRLAKEEGARVVAAHFDHGIRGEASAADREFVVSLCEEWEIPCRVGRGDIPSLLADEGGNMEAVARRERYRFLVSVARELDASSIMTAHTADDRIETMLMNLFRGAGARGLSGIREAATIFSGRLYRPLLSVWRAEVVAYAAENQLQFREDTTNRDVRFLRNWVRHAFLPELENRIPSTRKILLRQACLYEREEKWLTRESRRFCEKHCPRRGSGELRLPVEPLEELSPWLLRGVLRYCLEESHAPRRIRSAAAVTRMVEMLSSRRTTWSLNLPGGFEARREYDWLIFGAEAEPPEWETVVLPMSGEVAIPHLKLRIRTEVLAREAGNPATSGAVKAGVHVAWFDADQLKGELTVRRFRPGDRICPGGMEGSQKVKQIFIDRKVPRRERGRVPVLCSGDDPVWVVGYRRDRRYLVSDATRRVLRVSVLPEPPYAASGRSVSGGDG